jgi:hypothetical protein
LGRVKTATSRRRLMILAIHRETHREIEAGTDTHEENALGISRI